MTSSVKERLTGALILIVALVIVVPELFSGRPEKRTTAGAPDAQSADAGPPLRSYTMDIAEGQAVQSPKATAPPAAAVVTPPPVIPEPTLPAGKSPAANAIAQTPDESSKPPESKPAESKPAESKTAESKPAATAAATARGWWVQLGSFSARANADRLAATLNSAGYSLRVSPTSKSGKELYRVLAGPEPDRAAAVELQARLTAAGHKGTLVAP